MDVDANQPLEASDTPQNEDADVRFVVNALRHGRMNPEDEILGTGLSDSIWYNFQCLLTPDLYFSRQGPTQQRLACGFIQLSVKHAIVREGKIT